MVRQLNHVLSARASEGFYVHDIHHGVAHRQEGRQEGMV